LLTSSYGLVIGIKYSFSNSTRSLFLLVFEVVPIITSITTLLPIITSNIPVLSPKSLLDAFLLLYKRTIYSLPLLEANNRAILVVYSSIIVLGSYNNKGTPEISIVGL
jgi:hypothetical protein